ncbi:MAG: hypothetical protein HRU70_13050 [Phycisphaeraceae bacterium]|nr:MAG: hypothetical protein HRU70_13050 [Phycisphaeraceae bacterium]
MFPKPSHRSNTVNPLRRLNSNVRPTKPGGSTEGLAPTQKALALVEGLHAARAAERDRLAAELASEALSWLQLVGDSGLWSRLRARISPANADAARAVRLAADGLLARWHLLTPEAQDAAIVLTRDPIPEIVERLSASGDPQTRKAACSIARARGGPDTLLAVTPLIADPDPDVAQSAGAALRDLAARDHPTDADLDHARRAVEAACRSYSTHHRPEPLLAALALLTPPARAARCPLTRWLDEPGLHEHGVLARHLRSCSDASAPDRALELAWHPTLAAACRDRLDAAPLDDAARLWARWHLLHRPKRRASLLGSKVFAAPPAPRLATLSPDARAGLARAADLARREPTDRERLADALLEDPDTRVRLAASRACPWRTLEDFALDRDEHVARSVVLRLSAVGQPAPARLDPLARIAPILARSRHDPLRVIAGQELARHDWLNPASPAARAEARRRVLRDRAGALAAARDAWADADRAARARLVAWFEAQGLLDDAADLLADALTTAAPAADRDLLAAAAARALPACDAPGVPAAIDAALHHPDPRVRANAAQSIPRGPHTPDLAPLLADPHHRVRSTAAATLDALTPSTDPAALAVAHEMTTDPRDAHRLAGVWLAERLLARALPGSLLELKSRLEAHADLDACPRVRFRAGIALARSQGHAPRLALHEDTR